MIEEFFSIVAPVGLGAICASVLVFVVGHRTAK